MAKSPAPFAPPVEKPQAQYAGLVKSLQALHAATGKDIINDLIDFNSYEHLDKYLAELGLRKFAPLACGTNGAVLEITQGQVIRLDYPINIVSRVAIHEELQAISQGALKGVLFEVLPKLNTKVTSTDSYSLDSHLTRKGYSPNHFSYSSGDLGYLPDGTLLAVDQEGVNEPKDKKITPEDAQWLVASTQESIFPYLRGTGYISKQEHFFPALVDGRIRGILSDDDIERLQKGELEALKSEKPECFKGVTAANLPEFIHLAKDEGWYPSQAYEMMQKRKSEIKSPPPRKGRDI